jgi:hypothetical protein
MDNSTTLVGVVGVIFKSFRMPSRSWAFGKKVVLVLLVGGSLWIVPTNAISMAIVPNLPILFLLLCLLSHELSPHMVSILSKSFGMITNPRFFFFGGLGSPI